VKLIDWREFRDLLALDVSPVGQLSTSR